MNDEVILPRRVLPQPTPVVSPSGGDCGACVLAGLTGRTSVEDVYRDLREGDQTALSWVEMRGALWAALRFDEIDRIIDDVPFWPEAPYQATFGSPSWEARGSWFNYVRMAIDAGYYGIASVAMRGGGPIVETDHWLMIVGAREIHPPSGSGLIRTELLLSCSSRSTPDEEWIDAGTFLRERGGYNVLLVRPA